MNNLKIIEQELCKIWDGCPKIEVTAYCSECKYEKLCKAFIEVKEVLK